MTTNTPTDTTGEAIMASIDRKIQRANDLRITNWVKDIAEMHTKYGFNEKIRQMDPATLKAMLKFRLDFLKEELTEAYEAKSADDIVDAMIDLIVVAIGTLNAYDVDPNIAWNRVHAANMAKEVGIKAGRPNPLGLPDLVKPPGWTAPTHVDNVGLLEKIYGTN